MKLYYYSSIFFFIGRINLLWACRNKKFFISFGQQLAEKAIGAKNNRKKQKLEQIS
jgi:hypothetical protein